MTIPTFIQARAFFEYVIGFKALGAAGDETVQAAYSPEARAFLEARQDNLLPGTTWNATQERLALITAPVRALCDALDAGPNGDGASSRSFVTSAEHGHRVSELIEANTREVDRRRKAEALAVEMLTSLRNLLVIAGTPITARQVEVFAGARATIAKAEDRS
jgi:hypothetical protein